MRTYLDFEKPVAELEAKVEELRAMGESGSAVSVGEEINRLEAKAAMALKELYADLTPWQKTQVARHPQRPHCLDYIAGLITEFMPLAGDRKFGDDAAIVGGFGRLNGESVCVIGHEKGSDTESRIKHNFGMARPEGYRKAVRLMNMADHFEIPVIALIDTAGAYPGIGAEERGQA
ncbi:MAG: carboxyl transferase domain-containing protein, partial [Pseudolabrys sp.]